MHTYDIRKSRFSFAQLEADAHGLETCMFETTNRFEAMVFLNMGYLVFEHRWDDKKNCFVDYKVWDPIRLMDVRGFQNGHSCRMAKIPGRLPT